MLFRSLGGAFRLILFLLLLVALVGILRLFAVFLGGLGLLRRFAGSHFEMRQQIADDLGEVALVVDGAGQSVEVGAGAFFDHVATLGVEGVTVSPGYAYERAPVQDHFLSRRQTKELFRSIFSLGKARGAKWKFNQSSMYLD